MNLPKYLIIAWLTLGALLTIGNVGKPRKPITPLDASLGLVFTIGLALLVVAA